MRISLASLILILCQCSQPLSVSVNNNPVFDPNNRLYGNQVRDPSLQGCINLAVRQQDLQNASEITILSCANSEVVSLDNIRSLPQLRFLDLGNNSISDLRPLQSLSQLGGLNLGNNFILDISPLLLMTSIASVSLSGNNAIDCAQLDALEARLGDGLSRPITCQN